MAGALFLCTSAPSACAWDCNFVNGAIYSRLTLSRAVFLFKTGRQDTHQCIWERAGQLSLLPIHLIPLYMYDPHNPVRGSHLLM